MSDLYCTLIVCLSIWALVVIWFVPTAIKDSEFIPDQRTRKVKISGEEYTWSSACRAIGINRTAAKSMRERHGWSHQETIDHYLVNGKRMG